MLIIDEAQNLSADVLEQLRLSDQSGNQRAQAAADHPHRPARAAHHGGCSPALEQLAQRVIARFHLDALSAQEPSNTSPTAWPWQACKGPLPFSRSALRRVHALSRGIPRRINLLCDRALLAPTRPGAARSAPHRADERRLRCLMHRVGRCGAQRPGPVAPLGGGGSAAWRRVPPGGGRLGPGARPQWSRQGVVSSAAPAGATASKTSASAPFSAPPSSAASTAAVTTPTADGRGFGPRGAAPVAMSDLRQFVAALPASDTAALAGAGLDLGASVADGADACAALPRDGLRCYRNRRAGLNRVRQIDRPVLLTLFPSEEGDVAVAAVLRRLDGDMATLEGAGRTVRVPVAELAQVWRGDMATLWRTPPDMPDKGDWRRPPPAAAWLDQQLATAAAGGRALAHRQRPCDHTGPAPARIQRFQLARVTPGRPGRALDPHAAQPCQRRERTALAHRRLNPVSYILDALRRAEAERGRGAVPDIHTRRCLCRVPCRWPGGQPSARCWWLWRWLLWPPWRLAAPVVLQRPVPAGAVVVAAAPATCPVTPSMPAVTPTAPVATVATPEPAPAVAPAVTPPPAPAPRPAAPQRERRARAQPLRGAALSRRRPRAAAPCCARPARARPQRPPACRRFSSGQSCPAAAPAATGTVFAQADLPEAVRAQLPSLKISGVTYSSNPVYRMAIVSGQGACTGDLPGRACC